MSKTFFVSIFFSWLLICSWGVDSASNSSNYIIDSLEILLEADYEKLNEILIKNNKENDFLIRLITANQFELMIIREFTFSKLVIQQSTNQKLTTALQFLSTKSMISQFQALWWAVIGLKKFQLRFRIKLH